MRFLRIITLPLALVVGLAACSTDTSSTTPAASSGHVVVHTSGPIWATVAQAVAGDKATVTSTSMGPDQDPHSFEPSAQDKLAFSKATIVVINGGHYDEWAEEMVTGLGKGDATIDAMSLSGGDHDHGDETSSTPSATPTTEESHDHAGEDGHDHGDETASATPTASAAEEGHDHAHEGNEHVFQSIPTAEAVAGELAVRLGKADPSNAATYTANAKAFEDSIHTLLSDAQKATASHQGAKVVATEALSGLLIEDLGLVDATPAAYVEQSETDDGPSVATLAEAEKVVRSGEVKLLLVNAQTTDEASKKLQAAAADSKVPVVTIHETLPEGVTTYDAYMKLHIDAIVKALG